MGGEGVSDTSGKRLQLAGADHQQQDTGDKLAQFGRDLFHKGKTLVEGAEKQAQNIDFKGIANQAQEKLKNIDVNQVANGAGKVLQNVDGNTAIGVAGTALGFGFPQIGLLSRGSQEAGDFIAKKRANSLLDNQETLADKMLTSFDELDREKSGFLDDGKLRRYDGLTGIGSDNRALSLIMRAGYTTFNSLDGDASKKGISREDMQIFSTLQNKELLSDYVAKTAWNHGLAWGTAGAAAGAFGGYVTKAGMDFSATALKSAPIGRVALAATIGAIAVGGAANLISRHTQHNFFEEKKIELDRMVKAMKASF